MDDEQSTLWNGSSGRAWVDAQEVLDRMYKPIEDLIVGAVAAHGGRQVLDVGCGTGATTLAVARLLGATGRCAGIDISEPMLAAARTRAEREGTRATFIRADAQDYPFEPAHFDTVVSRFGVMFFAEPVRAFANLRRAAAPNAALRLVTWRSAAENPFSTAAEHAAAALLPNLPPRQPDAPGQFAFASPARVRTILEESGWADVDLQPIDVECTLPEKELDRLLTRLGPVGRALQDSDDATRARIMAAIRPALAPYVRGDDVRYTAACWMVGGRAA